MYKALVPDRTSVTRLKLKPIIVEDLPAVLELDRLCFGGLWTLDGYQRELESPNSNLIGIFTPSPPHPLTPSPPPPLLAIGCLWAILEEAHITILGVHPRYRHQGLGQMLLVALLTAACDRDLERATLEVRASNAAAVSLYEKFDFNQAGHRRSYYQDPNEDALVLWRSGLSKPEFRQTLASWYQEASDRLIASGWDLSSTTPHFLDKVPNCCYIPILGSE